MPGQRHDRPRQVRSSDFAPVGEPPPEQLTPFGSPRGPRPGPMHRRQRDGPGPRPGSRQLAKRLQIPNGEWTVGGERHRPPQRRIRRQREEVGVVRNPAQPSSGRHLPHVQSAGIDGRGGEATAIGGERGPVDFRLTRREQRRQPRPGEPANRQRGPQAHPDRRVSGIRPQQQRQLQQTARPSLLRRRILDPRQFEPEVGFP
jgi:hypothetical protein